MLDESKRNDNYLPHSLFNIVPTKQSERFTPEECKELAKMFNLSDDENISKFEDA